MLQAALSRKPKRVIEYLINLVSNNIVNLQDNAVTQSGTMPLA